LGSHRFGELRVAFAAETVARQELMGLYVPEDAVSPKTGRLS
jgi:hypothetical protein